MKLLRFSLFFIFFSFSVVEAYPRTLPDELELLPNPYDLITVLPYVPPTSVANEAQLKFMVKKNVNSILQVGCADGNTTQFLAALLSEKGRVYAVDAWDSFDPVAKTFKQPLVFHRFLSNMIYAGAVQKVVPIRMDRDDAVRALKVRAQLIVLDMKNLSMKEAYYDLAKWFRRTTKNCAICGNNWSSSEVQNAVRKFAKKRNLRIEASDDFWSFPNVKPVKAKVDDDDDDDDDEDDDDDDDPAPAPAAPTGPSGPAPAPQPVPPAPASPGPHPAPPAPSPSPGAPTGPGPL